MRAPRATRDALKPIVVGVLFACATAWLACSRGERLPRKTHLARLPAKIQGIAISEEVASYAYVERNESETRIVHDGVPRDTFPGRAIVSFSPGKRRLFYWLGSDKDGFLVADGTRIGGDFGRVGNLVFTPDGSHWAAACGARDDSAAHPGSTIVLADGKELGRYPDASEPSFSRDGRHLAYLAAVEGGGTKLIVDGTERAAYAVPHDECAAREKPRQAMGPNFWPQFQVKYLSDGRLLVMTQDQEGWGIYRDGTLLKSYGASLVQSHATPSADCASLSAVAAWSFTVAEKAPVAAWWERPAGSEEPWRVVIDGKPADSVVCDKPWLRQPPELSPDGRHVAYPCAVKDPPDAVFLVADGRRHGPYADVWGFGWADDGAHLGYGASDGSPSRPWRIFVDGEARTDSSWQVWRPRVESGTGRVAWESIPDAGGRGVMGFEHRRIASFDEVVWGPAFLRRGTVTWVIRHGRRLTRIDAATR